MSQNKNLKLKKNEQNESISESPQNVREHTSAPNECACALSGARESNP